MRPSIRTFLAIACFAVCLRVQGDSWRLPTPEIYLSSSGTVAVRIVPRQVSSQLDFFEDLQSGLATPGQPPDAPTMVPYAEVYRDDGYGSLSFDTSFVLLNEVSPVSALVSDDGRFLVTFDNWHFVGRGENVVVIYRTDGSVVRSMALSDFLTEQDIRGLRRTVSSTWWSGKHYIDAQNKTLVLVVATCLQREPDCADRFAEIRVDLTSGTLTQPIKDLLPHREGRVTIVSPDVPAAQPHPTAPPSSSCAPDWSPESFEGAVPVPLGKLMTPGGYFPLPAYSELAMKANVQGMLIVEILVSPQGDVVCVHEREQQGLAFGLTQDAVSTLMGWKVERLPQSDRARKSTVALRYEIVLVPPSSE